MTLPNMTRQNFIICAIVLLFSDDNIIILRGSDLEATDLQDFTAVVYFE